MENNNTGSTIGKIFLAIIVIALLWFAYQWIFGKPKDGTACDSDGDGIDDGTYVGGICVKTALDSGTGAPGGPTLDSNIQPGTIGLNPALNSVLVSASTVSGAQSPSAFFNNIHKGNIASFNVMTVAGSNPDLIHFRTRFDAQCPQYIWHKKWLYSFITEKIVPSADSRDPKICYYKVERSALPNQINILLNSAADSCPSLRLFISGAEYAYSQTKTEFVTTPSGHWINYCAYNKK